MKTKLIQILIALALLIGTYRVLGVQVTHFEDGSGIVTYCIPLTDCSK